jgi:DNA polymerase III alpha subunit
VAFARACRAAEIQPVIGMTLAVREPDGTSHRPDETGAGPGQLVLLATGPAGHRSLCRLSSLIQGSPDREALAARGVGWDELAAHREGLICLSGSRRGWIERQGIAQNYRDTGAERVEAPPFDRLRARSADTFALYPD